MVLRKFTLLVAMLLFFPPLLSAAEDCATLLRQIGERGLQKNSKCENCVKNLIDALRDGPDHAMLSTYWVAQGPISYQKLKMIDQRAHTLGIEILEDLSQQYTYRHPSWNSTGLLVNFVFRGAQGQLVQFFESIDQDQLTLAAFDILNSAEKTVDTSLAQIQARDKQERGEKLREAITAAYGRMILLNDIPSGAFAAFVPGVIYDDYLNQIGQSQEKPARAIVTKDALLGDLEKNMGLIDANRVIEVSNGAPPVYIVSLKTLSDIQRNRAGKMDAYRVLQQKIGAAEASVPKAPMPKVTRTRLVSVTFNDTVLRRAATFGKGGPAELGPKLPAAQITFRGTPRYVIFYPEWLKSADLDDVYAQYRRSAGDRKMTIPKKIIDLINEYRADNLKNYRTISMSDINAKTISAMARVDAPMIWTPLKRDVGPDALSYVVLPVWTDESGAEPEPAATEPAPAAAAPEPKNEEEETFYNNLSLFDLLVESLTFGDITEQGRLRQLEMELRQDEYLPMARDLLPAEELKIYNQLALGEPKEGEVNFAIIQKIMRRLIDGSDKAVSRPSRMELENQFKGEVIALAPAPIQDAMRRNLYLHPRIRGDITNIGHNGKSIEIFAKYLARIFAGTGDISRAADGDILKLDTDSPTGSGRVLFVYGKQRQVIILAIIKRNDAYGKRFTSLVESRLHGMKKLYPAFFKK